MEPMKRITIECGYYSRLVIYKEGGLQLESYIPNIGWIIDDGPCNAIHLLTNAEYLLAKVKENLIVVS